jgi:hypothetical protein
MMDACLSAGTFGKAGIPADVAPEAMTWLSQLPPAGRRQRLADTSQGDPG